SGDARRGGRVRPDVTVAAPPVVVPPGARRRRDVAGCGVRVHLFDRRRRHPTAGERLLARGAERRGPGSGTQWPAGFTARLRGRARVARGGAGGTGGVSRRCITRELMPFQVARSSRVDAFVRSVRPGWSRRTILRLLREGAIRVNGRIARKGDGVRAGDQVWVPEIPGLLAVPGPAIVVRYEDAHLVVVEKPAPMSAHALDPRERDTLVNALLVTFPEIEGVGDPLGWGLAHRLDAGTSGLLVVARTAEVWRALRRAFRAREVEKTYLAIVAGRVAGVRVIDTAVAHSPPARARVIPAAGARTRAWPAITRVRGLRASASCSLVEASMRTGVTHQIRAHLASIGHPILADTLYGGPASDLPAGRHAL